MKHLKKYYEKITINYNLFLDCKNPKFCYLLGYLWADGWATKTDFRIQIQEQDGLVFKKILDSIEIHYSLTIKKGTTDKIGVNRKTAYIFCFGKDLLNFLISLDYCKKSYISHQKIMEFIPKENLHYWIRGYFDGDGCFYFNQKWKTKQANIGSAYEQDWDYFLNFLNSINVSAKAFKNTHKKSNSKSSLLRFCGKQIVNFGNYIYKGKLFGLNRKYDKFLLIAS